MKKFIVIFATINFFSCSSGMQVQGNEQGSDPINQQEVLAYKQAVARCYKTGGSRIVKIDGKLRCF